MTPSPVRLIIAHYRPDIVSGAERAIADVAAMLDRRFQLTMLVPGEGNLAAFYRERGLPVWVRRVETRRRRYPGLHLLHSLQFAAALRSRGAQLVLANTFAATGRVGTGTRLARTPHAVYVREYMRPQPLHARLLRQATRVLAVSADVRRYVTELANLPPEQVTLAYDPIDALSLRQRVEKHRQTGERALPFPPETPVIGWVGRITPYKQPDLFVRAAALVLHTHPQAAFFVAGSAVDREQEYAGQVHALARDLQIAERVRFLGSRPDAPELISEASAVCLTSTREPFPRVVLEAQVIGTPVIAANSGGCPEMVQDRETGLLFSSTGPQAAEELANCMRRLLDEPAYGPQLAENARRHVLRTAASRAPLEVLESTFDELAFPS